MKEHEIPCELCGEVYDPDELIPFDDRLICPECLENETTLCACCGQRIWLTDNAGNDNTPLCQTCYNQSYMTCSECGRLIHCEDSYYLDDSDEPLCLTCLEEANRDVIQGYYYKPEPIFYGTGPRYFGVELEIDEGGERGDYASRILSQANVGFTERLYCKHDGSLSNGFELVTHPMSLEYHQEEMPWPEVLRTARSLASAAEERGTDAAGIAYHAGGRLHIMKKAKPAHVLRFRIPLETSVVMGHTRYATQGDAKKAYNAHPFQGQIGGKKFALAHNGVLLNDRLLQQAEDLPKTHIETDSYVAVQLLEKQNALNFNSLRKVAEEVQGTFVFTVLDAQDNLYFVHGDNPLCLYHFPKQGIYVYASTQSILEHGLTASGLSFLKKPVEVKTDEGDILRIDRHGKQKLQHFCINSFCPPCYSDAIEWYPKPLSAGRRNPDAYWEGLVSVAASFGYTPKDIHTLRECGFTSDEIEDFLYCGEI